MRCAGWKKEWLPSSNRIHWFSQQLGFSSSPLWQLLSIDQEGPGTTILNYRGVSLTWKGPTSVQCLCDPWRLCRVLQLKLTTDSVIGKICNWLDPATHSPWEVLDDPEDWLHAFSQPLGKWSGPYAAEKGSPTVKGWCTELQRLNHFSVHKVSYSYKTQELCCMIFLSSIYWHCISELFTYIAI